MGCKLRNQGSHWGGEGGKEGHKKKNVSETYLPNRVKQITKLCEAIGLSGDCSKLKKEFIPCGMRRTNSIAGDCYHVGMQAQGLPSFSHFSNPEIHIFM